MKTIQKKFKYVQETIINHPDVDPLLRISTASFTATVICCGHDHRKVHLVDKSSSGFPTLYTIMISSVSVKRSVLAFSLRLTQIYASAFNTDLCRCLKFPAFKRLADVHVLDI